jgi:hypothetical protein
MPRPRQRTRRKVTKKPCDAYLLHSVLYLDKYLLIVIGYRQMETTPVE